MSLQMSSLIQKQFIVKNITVNDQIVQIIAADGGHFDIFASLNSKNDT